MPRYTDSHYQKLADAIVKDHVEESVPLETSYQKVAQDFEMNANEAERLLQATNTAAHLAIFEKMGADRYVDFRPLEPQTEMSNLFAPEEKVASADVPVDAWALNLDLPHERRDALRGEVEKVAASLVPEVEEPEAPGPYEGQRGWNAVALLEKTASELEMELRVAHLDYEDAMDKLASLLQRVDAIPYDEFEKDAAALHGAGSEPVIAKLRERMKVAATTPFHRDANHFVIVRREHDAMRSVMEAFDVTKKYAQAYEWMKKESAPLVRT